VRRTASPWTATVQALLRHLRAVGFTLAPTLLRIDEQGREVLSLLEGDAAWWPWPTALRTDEGLRRVRPHGARAGRGARLLRRAAGAVWHGGPRTDPGHVLRHGDLGPWNTLWRGDELTGVIDFDTAEPAPPGWDTAQAAWFFVTLRPLTGYRAGGPTFTDDDVLRRFRVWCEESGVTGASLLGRVAEVQRFERDRIADRGAAGHEPYATFLRRGDVVAIDGDRAWLAEHADRLLRLP